VPELSRFYGIVIGMFAEGQGRHHRPHFHAFYQEHAAVFAIDPVELIAGSLPRTQKRLVEAWAELHQQTLFKRKSLQAIITQVRNYLMRRAIEHAPAQLCRGDLMKMRLNTLSESVFMATSRTS
jgi:hypothetical protein